MNRREGGEDGDEEDYDRISTYTLNTLEKELSDSLSSAPGSDYHIPNISILGVCVERLEIERYGL